MSFKDYGIVFVTLREKRFVMDIQASKIELVKMILDLEDSKLIEKVRNLLTKEKKDFYDEFTEDQKLEIQYGIEQLDRGEKVPWEEVYKRIS
ncbi:hypothetical protein [Flavobacterium psychrotrophum]|uniref:hypothetical protein n=1 Tax=Flavobacterium psychrotrophum TaxID=2294119 RepID=UPI000E30D6BC|nr:hypothetical protein [Flavobacterium psychrotrophum]